MNGFALDSDGDIYLEKQSDGRYRFARCGTRREAVLRNVGTNLRTELGEHFHDEELGVPWVGGILGQGRLGAVAARGTVADVARAVEGVATVESVDVAAEGRTLSLRYSLTLDDGTTAAGSTEAS